MGNPNLAIPDNPAAGTAVTGIGKKIGYFLTMIDIGHSLFALPFAYMGAILAYGGIPTLYQLAWITLAMVSARTAALALNRLIDRHIDARNPRTANWILPSGLIRPYTAVLAVLVSLVLLMISAAKLNQLCFYLAPLAVVVLVGYSYTKRFTWTCHVILGLAIAMGPVGAWIAVAEGVTLVTILLALAVALWIAGFDIMYACQDEQFDREQGLFSIPGRFGTPLALDIAAWFHALTIMLLVAVGLGMGLGWLYFVGIIIAALILRFEHRLVTPEDLSKMHTAAFGLNRYVSMIIFIFTLISL